VLVNTCAGVARRRGRQRYEIRGNAACEPSVPDAFAAIIDRDELERGFRRLSVDHRAVLVLHHYLDMPVERVAEVLEIPEGTVKSRVHRALAQMRIALDVDRPRRPATYREASR
jgi:RNA polymerase sigma-70 factor (ECF subfamily)